MKRKVSKINKFIKSHPVWILAGIVVTIIIGLNESIDFIQGIGETVHNLSQSDQPKEDTLIEKAKFFREQGNKFREQSLEHVKNKQDALAKRSIVLAEDFYLKALNSGDRYGAFGLSLLYQDPRLSKYLLKKGSPDELKELGEFYLEIWEAEF
ncbi:MAG: hypothetical protein AAF984_08005 [Verrucomicrobiota bacterium]